jgi:hypothetical protein
MSAIALALSACVPPAPPAPAEPPSRAALPEPVPVAAASAPEPSPAPPEPCDDSLAGRLARVSCSGERILVAHAIEMHPSRAVPKEPTRSVLGAVAELLRRRPDILFVRIEVHATEPVGSDAAQMRKQIADAQARADALFGYLWRRLHISAERLEAVGYPSEPGSAPSAQRFRVVLRVVQRAGS